MPTDSVERNADALGLWIDYLETIPGPRMLSIAVLERTALEPPSAATVLFAPVKVGHLMPTGTYSIPAKAVDPACQRPPTTITESR